MASASNSQSDECACRQTKQSNSNDHENKYSSRQSRENDFRKCRKQNKKKAQLSRVPSFYFADSTLKRLTALFRQLPHRRKRRPVLYNRICRNSETCLLFWLSFPKETARCI